MMEIPSSPWIENLWPEGDRPGLSQIRKQAPCSAQWNLLPGKLKHVFSHFELELVVAKGAVAKHSVARATPGVWVAPGRLKDQALPSVMLKIARHALGLV
jgi:A/G-specific adenine glycosylase